jgi:hypothetical protein
MKSSSKKVCSPEMRFIFRMNVDVIASVTGKKKCMTGGRDVSCGGGWQSGEGFEPLYHGRLRLKKNRSFLLGRQRETSTENKKPL